ncbi:glycosyltransferase [Microbacterium sp. USHLN186]|uniref:glycosyltransferase n=1 Tax=Microbacterium sp. USHLN186 TaxID=3081286 RepID=UPI0030196436
MRILGVVTLVSPDGEYGGPTRVALNQLAALRDLGHDVVLAGGQRGFPGPPPVKLEGVRTRLFPVMSALPRAGFAGLASPRLWRAVHRHRHEFDVIHVHAARDLVTLPAAYLAQRGGARVVLQTHGMIDPSSNPLAGPLDAVLTRRVLKSAHAVAYLSEVERAGLREVTRGAARLVELPNGVPEGKFPSSRPDVPHVLYLARLAKRKRPVHFVQAATVLAQEFPEVRFTLIGPDEGEGASVRAAILRSGYSDRIRWEGAVSMSETASRMQEASIYVLPSVDEPYPMSVLEAMSVGLPVIVTETCGLASFVAESDAGTVIGSSLSDLIESMRGLIADPDRARATGERGRQAVREKRSMAAIARQLEQLYL